jgi:putative slyX protein
MNQRHKFFKNDKISHYSKFYKGWEKLMQELIDLQIKIAYLEDTLESLNHVIAVQDKQLMDLQDQLKLIYVKLDNLNHDQNDIAPFDLLADKPPHF